MNQNINNQENNIISNNQPQNNNVNINNTYSQPNQNIYQKQVQDNNLNNQPQNNSVNTNNAYSQPNQNKNRNKPYWLIPIILFLGFVIITLIVFLLEIAAEETVGGNESISNNLVLNLISLLNVLRFLSGLLVLPSIPFVIILNNKKSNSKYEPNELINSNISPNEQLLMAYVGNNYEKISKNKFNFAACFFSIYYLIYRKCYFSSLIILTLNIILSRIFNGIVADIIPFIFIITIGFLFNSKYIEYCKKQIEKIKNENNNLSQENLIEICSKKGGVLNIGYLIIGIILLTICSTIINSIIGLLN